MKRYGIKLLSLLLAMSVLFSFPVAAQADDFVLTARYDYGVELEWNDVYSADSYNIYRSTDGVNYQCLGYSSGNNYYWDDTAQTKNIYYYYIAAVHYNYDDYSYSETEFSYSNVASVTTCNPFAITLDVDRYSDKKGITLDWYFYDDSGDIDGIYIFRSVNGGDYQLVADLPSNTRYWTDASATAYANYRYTAATYTNVNGNILCYPDLSKTVEAVNELKGVTLTTKTKSETVKWKKVPGASKVVVYQTKGWDTSSLKPVAELTGNKTSVTVKNVNNKKYDYTYCVYAYNAAGQLIAKSLNYYSSDSEALFRAARKKKKNKNTVPVVNVRTKKTTKAWSSSISKKDKKILDKFAKKHFKKSWTDVQKAEYTMRWINRNVKYARNNYNKIANCSYVEAIFNKKLGQCLQYNGAYAAFLTFLGYDARIVQGWRGSNMKHKWSHYWCEINIDGTWMLMETGNYDSDGDWMYFCTPYRDTSGYLINQKPAK